MSQRGGNPIKDISCKKNLNFIRPYVKNPDKKSTDDEKSGNDIENFSQSLFVECAEKAISVS